MLRFRLSRLARALMNPSLGTIAAIGMTTAMVGAHAAAPPSNMQAPGFYRMTVGAFEITALSDGVFDLDTDAMLANTTPVELHGLLERSFHAARVATSVNAYLINTGERLILVDTGAAQSFGPTLGHLLANLAASGYRPDQVDTILITHMHPDHIGGLVADGRATFPNATVWVDRRDVEFWSSATALAAAGDDRKAFFSGAVAAMKPYVDAGRLRRFEAPADLVPGVRALPAPGHTPGHTLYSVESNGQRIVMWGDLMEVASVQFARPAVTIAFDADPAEAVRQRRPAYTDAAGGRYLVAGAHLPFPGIGHVRKERIAYSWTPIDYAAPR